MTEEELELLKQIQEDLNLVKQEYGCTVDREELLKGVLERNEHPVRPEEAELFFSGVLPSGWRNCYFREPKMLSKYLNELRKAISVDWCENYLEPELRGLQGSESLRDCVISISQMKKDLNLPLRKDNMLSSHAEVESYLKEMRKRAGISPYFRFIPPKRFAEIVDIYLEAMEERGDCTQEELGRLLGMTQSAVSKLRKVKNYIPADQEFGVLLGLCKLFIRDEMRNERDTWLSMHMDLEINLCAIKANRLFAVLYLAVLLGFSVCFRNIGDSSTGFNVSLTNGEHLPETIGGINFYLERRGFAEQFDPDANGTIPLWRLIRLPDNASLLEAELTLNEIMGMDAAYLRLLYRMPEVFFSDLQLDVYKWHADLQSVIFYSYKQCTPYAYLKEMRKLRQPGLKCLMSKMETITIGWNMLSFYSNTVNRDYSVFDPIYLMCMRLGTCDDSNAAQKLSCDSIYCDNNVAQVLSVYLKEFFQLMEYLSDSRLYPDAAKVTGRYQSQMSCDCAIHQNDLEISKPLTEPQEREYRKLFEKYIRDNWQSDLFEQIKLKISMTIQEWYFWLKMELLWWSETNSESWHAFMEQCMEEARRADRDAAETAPDT